MDTIHDILHSIINHFIPHEGNDYRPHLLQKAAFFGLFGMVVLSFTIANFQALLWQSSHWLVGAVLPAVVIDLTNEQRKENNLATLVHNPVLDAAANLKAQDMAKGSYFSHNSPTGVTPWHWFDEAGYTYVYAGENLAVFFTDSSAVVDAWMKSPTHRANIVGSHYTEIGVGTAKGKYNGYDTVFVVQLFGAPALKPAPVAVVPKPKPTVVAVPARTVPLFAPTTTATRTAPIAARRVLGAETTDKKATPAPTKVTKATTTREQLALATEEPTVSTTTVADATTSDATSSLAATVSTTSTDEATPTVVAGTFATDDFVAIQSDLATSHTNLQPAPVMSVDRELDQSIPVAARLATEPHRVLQIIYIFIGIFTMLALFASVIIEWRQHRPVQTAYGLLLLVLMCGLFVLHATLTAGAVII
jgi:hypothetical protein